MKTQIVTILLLLSINVIAQFPAPVNFQFSYEYIMIDDWGICNGQGIFGPSYCSYFEWGTPDTTTTTARLTKYKIYYKTTYDDISVIDSTSNNFYSSEIGIIGSVWVTAVYSNPNGESLASNIITNGSLPVQVKEVSEPKKIKLNVDSQNKILIIDTEHPIQSVKVINSEGKQVLLCVNPTGNISLKGIAHGVYILEINDDEGNISHDKITL
ncbi:MAG: T9SS type A sorting domain-containing protein [Paludibacter sp.]|jgi:hypothetical protein|nr:T9SS type A sorting domain-containing protein [Paludibacter sp.]